MSNILGDLLVRSERDFNGTHTLFDLPLIVFLTTSSKTIFHYKFHNKPLSPYKNANKKVYMKKYAHVNYFIPQYTVCKLNV